MTYLTRAIFSLRPSAQFTFTDEDYSTIEWHELEGNAPTAKEIQDEILRLKALDVAVATEQAARKAEILDRLGLTEDEAKLLLS